MQRYFIFEGKCVYSNGSIIGGEKCKLYQLNELLMTILHWATDELESYQLFWRRKLLSFRCHDENRIAIRRADFLAYQVLWRRKLLSLDAMTKTELLLERADFLLFRLKFR